MPKKKGVGQPESRHSRPLTTNDKSVLKIGYDNSWAVVIGIDHYEDDNIRNLKHAVNDARGMAELLINSLGFLKDNVYVILDPAPSPREITEFNLIDRKATKETIEKLLLSDIPDRIKKDDRLLIFYAGHGERRPIAGRKQGIGYLVPSSAKSGEWHTYVEMNAIIQVLNWSAAKHIFYLLDCCYSGLATARAIPKESDFTEVCFANRALECLTAGTARQAVDDDGPEGHSTFTWTVLQGLKKEADWNGDDIITGTDLMVYVKNKLISTYGKNQTPDFGYFSGHESGGDFVFRLPELSSQDFFNLGVLLYDLGQRIDDPGRFESAARHFEKALVISRSAGISFPETELWLGKSLLAAEQTDEALKVLKMLTEGDPSETPPEAWFYLGVVCAKQRNFVGAAEAFEKFVSRDPHNENASWIRDYIKWLRQEIKTRKRAILIGINKYVSRYIPELRGCVNDVNLMKDTLQKKLGFFETDIVILTDEMATSHAIVSALQDLARISSATDTVIVHFSGHSVPDSKTWGLKCPTDVYLITNDTLYNTKKRAMTIGIGAQELHNLMNSIPSVQKTLILDTHPNPEFSSMAIDANYVVLNAAYPGELTYESSFFQNGIYITAGLLSYAVMEKIWSSEPTTLTQGELLIGSIDRMRSLGFNQNPQLIGNPNQVFCGREDIYLYLWEFSQRRRFASFHADSLKAKYDKHSSYEAGSFPLVHCSFGRAFIEKKCYIDAIKALKASLDLHSINSHEANLILGQAYTIIRDFSEAEKNFRAYADSVDNNLIPAQFKDLITLNREARHCKRHALLIGIDIYKNKEVTSLKGACNDVAILKDILISHCNFQPQDVTIHLNGEANRSTIISDFKKLVRKASDQPAFFYFSGNGSMDNNGSPTLLSYDGRQEGIYDIELRELAELVNGNTTNLVTIIDAGWTQSIDCSTGSRYVLIDTREKPSVHKETAFVSTHGLPTKERDLNKLQSIGAVSIYAGSIRYMSSERLVVESEFGASSKDKVKKTYGELTFQLIQLLKCKAVKELTYKQWIETLNGEHSSLEPLLLGTMKEENVFAPHTLITGVLNLARKIEWTKLYGLIESLHLIAKRDEKSPEVYLNLGLTYTAVGEWDKSIKELQTAVNLYDDSVIMEKEKQKDPDFAEEIRYQSSYHLGRILYERKQDLGTAVDELRKAQKQNPDDVRICYYLGQAIRALVEQETLMEASKVLQKYIDKGAPLGRRTEVMEFLKLRQSTK